MCDLCKLKLPGEDTDAFHVRITAMFAAAEEAVSPFFAEMVEELAADAPPAPRTPPAPLPPMAGSPFGDAGLFDAPATAAKPARKMRAKPRKRRP